MQFCNFTAAARAFAHHLTGRSEQVLSSLDDLISSHQVSQHGADPVQKLLRGKLPALDLAQAEERYAYEPPEFDTPEKLFELRWTLTVLERVFERVREEYERLGKAEVYEAFKGLLAGETEIPFRELGESVGLSEGNARVTLFRMRKLYRRCLEEEIAETIPEGESIEEEIRHLHRILSS